MISTNRACIAGLLLLLSACGDSGSKDSSPPAKPTKPPVIITPVPTPDATKTPGSDGNVALDPQVGAGLNAKILESDNYQLSIVIGATAPIVHLDSNNASYRLSAIGIDTE